MKEMREVQKVGTTNPINKSLMMMYNHYPNRVTLINSLKRAPQSKLPSSPWSSGKRGAPTCRIWWKARSLGMHFGNATVLSLEAISATKPTKKINQTMRLVAPEETNSIVISILPIHILENAAGRKVKKLSAESRDKELEDPEEDQEKFALPALVIQMSQTRKFLTKKNKRRLKKKKNKQRFHSKQKKFINPFQSRTPTVSSFWRQLSKTKEVLNRRSKSKLFLRRSTTRQKVKKNLRKVDLFCKNILHSSYWLRDLIPCWTKWNNFILSKLFLFGN